MARVLIRLCISLVALMSMSACVIDRVKNKTSPEIREASTAVVHSKAEFDLRMRTGSTPLDAFTPFGKREFIAGMAWNSNGDGIGGLSMTPLIRELRADQVIKVLEFLNLKEMGQSIAGSLPDAPPLRLGEPGAAIEHEWRTLSRLIDEHARSEQAEDATTDLNFADIVTRYHEGLSPRVRQPALRTHSLGDLMLLFYSASNVADSTGDLAANRDMRNIFAELERRQVDTRRVFDSLMLASLVAQRRFDDAREFLARHPDPHAAAIPTLIDSLGPEFVGKSLLDFDSGTETLYRKAASTPVGTRVILMVGPTCHFSLDALNEIASNRVLRAQLIGADLLILTPPRSTLQLPSIGQWNTRHPDLSIRIPYEREGWSDIDIALVPQFLIFRDGKLVQRIVGWKDNQAALLKALAELPTR